MKIVWIGRSAGKVSIITSEVLASIRLQMAVRHEFEEALFPLCRLFQASRTVKNMYTEHLSPELPLLPRLTK
jgi:hypothetical protein